MTLDAIGNITYRSDVGSYTYHATRKHAVASTSNGWSFSYDNNGNMLTGRGQTLTWMSYNLPASVSNGSLSSSFSYTPSRQYWKQVANYSNGPETTIYVGGLLEKVTGASVTDYRHLISAGTATVIVTRSTGSNNNTYYVSRDSLGSANTITNGAATVMINESFAAYGARRGSAWSGAPSSGDWSAIGSTTRRGYTDHTMLDNLSLIHMNGRMYDPVIGRFVSADPFIDGADTTQGWNRYSYVKKNPLSMTDPSGFASHDRPSTRPQDGDTISARDEIGIVNSNYQFFLRWGNGYNSNGVPADSSMSGLQWANANVLNGFRGANGPMVLFASNSNLRQFGNGVQQWVRGGGISVENIDCVDNSCSAAPVRGNWIQTSWFKSLVGYPFVDDKGNAVRNIYGDPVIVPSDVDMHGFVRVGEMAKSWGIAMELLGNFIHGAAWDLQRVGPQQVYQADFRDASTVAIGIYAASAGIPIERLMTIQNGFAGAASTFGREAYTTQWQHLPDRNVYNTRTGYDLVTSGRLGRGP